jgi:hypothetical protein
MKKFLVLIGAAVIVGWAIAELLKSAVSTTGSM